MGSKGGGRTRGRFTGFHMDADEDSNIFAGVVPCFESSVADGEDRQPEARTLYTRDELKSMNAEELVGLAAELQNAYVQAVDDVKIMSWEFHEYQDSLEFFSKAVKLAHKLNSSNLDVVASIAINEIPQYLCCGFAALFLFDSEKGAFELLRSSVPFIKDQAELANAQVLFTLFASFKDPYLIEYKPEKGCLLLENGDMIKHPVPEAWIRASGRHLLMLPLTMSQSGSNLPSTVGGLVLGKSREGFGAKDADVAVIFSDLLSSSLHNAQLVRKLNELSIIDPLTQIYNRRHLMSQLSTAMIQARRHGHSLSIALLDIDHFKRVNDLHGHICGDDVLRAVAAALKNGIRKGIDVPARYGGEEFMVVMPFTGLETAVDVSDRLRNAIKGQVVDCENKNISVTCSFGVAEYLRGETMEQLIERADISLYQAKHGGRNRVCAAASSQAKTSQAQP